MTSASSCVTNTRLERNGRGDMFSLVMFGEAGTLRTGLPVGPLVIQPCGSPPSASFTPPALLLLLLLQLLKLKLSSSKSMEDADADRGGLRGSELRYSAPARCGMEA